MSHSHALTTKYWSEHDFTLYKNDLCELMYKLLAGI